jgi:hypothetical protein
VDGIQDLRLAGFVGDEPVLLARVELRPVLGWWHVGWVPRGPTAADHPALLKAVTELRARCRGAGCSLLVVDPYQPHAAYVEKLGQRVGERPRTMWLDLTLGRERLWEGLEKQWRYGVRASARLGVSVEQSCDDRDIERFWQLCLRVSRAKHFDLPGSVELARRLLGTAHKGPVRYRLFLAHSSGELAAGVVVAVCGRTMHQVWSAMDRDFRRHRPSEALRWAEVEWALSEGLERYDLEGVDPKRNPGTYDFKRRMGGIDVGLPGKVAIPLSPAGRLLGLGLRALL